MSRYLKLVWPIFLIVLLIVLENSASEAQTGLKNITLYISATEGSDSWTGRFPHVVDGGHDGPVRSLYGAGASYKRLYMNNTNAPVDLYVSQGVYGGFLPWIPANLLTVHLANYAVIRNFNRSWKLASTSVIQAKRVTVSKPIDTPKSTGVDPDNRGNSGTESQNTVISQTFESQHPATSTPSLPTEDPNRHYVFAHYMVCYKDYNNGVIGYEHDIEDAQSFGVDGFALNCGDWDHGPYKKSVADLFAAAGALNSGFKLFFSADMTGIQPNEITEMVDSYADSPNYFHFHGKPVLSTWGGEQKGGSSITQAFWSDILERLKDGGHQVFFVPYFYAQRPAGTGFDVEVPTYADVQSNYNQTWKGLIDGFFYPATAATPDRTTCASAAFASVLHDGGTLYMAGISPEYWGSKQISAGRRYVEYDGGEGIEKQWKAIIAEKADWVELFTWNDFTESTYWSPIDDPAKYGSRYSHGQDFFYSHAGALALCSYFIRWFKSGHQSSTLGGPDNLYCFYRTQPMTLYAPNDPQGPVSDRIGPINDNIYLTTITSSPVTLIVVSGGIRQFFNIGSGITNTTAAFYPGTQTFSLVRDNRQLLAISGHPIDQSSDQYNFNYYTAWAHD